MASTTSIEISRGLVVMLLCALVLIILIFRLTSSGGVSIGQASGPTSVGDYFTSSTIPMFEFPDNF